MIFDLRIYTCHPGKMADWLKLYQEKGFPIQVKHLGKPVFFATTEVGTLNQVVHCWPFQSMADREQRRAAMDADPGWAEYRKASAQAGYIARQEDSILKSVSFSPL